MQTALITGAGKGIGVEIARQLGNSGFHILLTGRKAAQIDEAVRKLGKDEVSAQPVVMDVAQGESIQAAFNQIAGMVKKIDVLVNNAGVLLDETTPLLSISREDFLQTFNVNAFGPFFVVQAFLPLLGIGSRIINVSSGAGQILDGITSWAPVYSMSKTTLNVVTMHLAHVLRSRHIAVNAVCPGWVRTDMGGRSAPRSLARGAETVVWLATEADHSITGKFFKDEKEISW